MGIAAGAVRKPGIPDDQAEALLLSARMDKKFAEDFGTVCFRRVQKPPKLLSDLAPGWDRKKPQEVRQLRHQGVPIFLGYDLRGDNLIAIAFLQQIITKTEEDGSIVVRPLPQTTGSSFLKMPHQGPPPARTLQCTVALQAVRRLNDCLFWNILDNSFKWI
jgi:hypothetical protein